MLLIANNCNSALNRLQYYLNQIQHKNDRPIVFDEFLKLRDEDRAKIVKAFQPLLDEGRIRARSAHEQGRFDATLCLVIANLLVSADRRRACRYSRAFGTYSGVSRHFPAFLGSRPLRTIIDDLAKLGLVVSKVAKPGTLSKKQSTFRPTKALIARLEALDVRLDGVGFDETRPVIIMKDANKKLIENHVAFDYLKPESDRCKAYHSFLASHSFTSGKNNKLRRQITPLQRIYNNYSMEQGGRFYGGWWQNMKSEQRKTIRIDGNETIELDYSGFMPRALYHNLNIDYQDDPYFIQEVMDAAEAEGLDTKKVRDSLKIIFLVILNGKDRRIDPEKKLVIPKSMSTSEIFDLMERKHQRISALFHTGHSTYLMKYESDICDKILERGIKDGVIVLPIHDSFIVDIRYHDWLYNNMNIVYYELFNYNTKVH